MLFLGDLVSSNLQFLKPGSWLCVGSHKRMWGLRETWQQWKISECVTSKLEFEWKQVMGLGPDSACSCGLLYRRCSLFLNVQQTGTPCTVYALIPPHLNKGDDPLTQFPLQGLPLNNLIMVVNFSTSFEGDSQTMTKYQSGNIVTRPGDMN